ncbi:MAG: hypothetical protein AB7G34_16805 [Hyphomicrobiales bacterium]
MKAFIISIALIAVISVGSAVVLQSTDMSAQSVYSTSYTRL